VALAQAMIEGKITKPMRVLKDGPAATAEKALTAEVVWPVAEFPTAEVKTAAGTEASSNAEIFSENNDIDSFCNLRTSHKYPHYGTYRKNIFFTSRHSVIRRAYVYEEPKSQQTAKP
jgi:hypothetical protein